MFRSAFHRRLSIAIKTATRPHPFDQVLLLDQIHRDLFLPETALESLALLQDLVDQTPRSSGFHSILLQHPILDEILKLIRTESDSEAGQLAVKMLDAWRHDIDMITWAQSHQDLILSTIQQQHINSDQSRPEPIDDLFESWFLKFRTDLQDAVYYITSGDIRLIRELQMRIIACLNEIDDMVLVDLLLQLNDLAQAFIDQGPCSDVDNLIADFNSRVTSIHLNAGGLCSDFEQSLMLSDSRSDCDRSEAPDLLTDEAELSAMLHSIAIRDQITKLNPGEPASNDDVVARFDPLFNTQALAPNL